MALKTILPSLLIPTGVGFPSVLNTAPSVPAAACPESATIRLSHCAWISKLIDVKSIVNRKKGAVTELRHKFFIASELVELLYPIKRWGIKYQKSLVGLMGNPKIVWDQIPINHFLV